MLNWSNQFNICCFLDSQSYPSLHKSYECVAGIGVQAFFKPGDDFFNHLSQFYATTDDWIFGHFSYDLKNRIEGLVSTHPDHVGYPEAFLFIPQVVLTLAEDKLTIGSVGDDPGTIYKQIMEAKPMASLEENVALLPRLSREAYIDHVNLIKKRILRGDCYEINFCQEFYSVGTAVNPISLYRELVTLSPNPFSAFYKLNELTLMCASPERYLKKTGSHLISQPIKGTLKRTSFANDDVSIEQSRLLNNAKERSENVMIVDLVRNDLSKICREGSVKVDELFGLYTFPHLYQMISTISGDLQEGTDLSDMLRATFPMGSMTGAPKRKVMEIIEEYENSRRGLYSGTVGYITPEKDFDFNVVIRSLMYNQQTRYLSCMAGSAITYQSNAEQEYDECLLKVDAIKKVLTRQHFSN
ncbi:anthranilate synthase component I family protein [Segetibacter sp. 3557_3]|nr:anthranilate synthase component I family protein [Segetibacter sp. 3557_3]